MQRLDEIVRRTAELEATRTELLALRERIDQLDPADCTDDDVCAALSSLWVARITRGPRALGQATG